jgi:hypothetical protein
MLPAEFRRELSIVVAAAADLHFPTIITNQR